MFCDKCGKELMNDSLFCPACGNRINAISSAPATSYTAAPNTAYAPPVDYRLYKQLGGMLQFVVIMYRYLGPIMLALGILVDTGLCGYLLYNYIRFGSGLLIAIVGATWFFSMAILIAGIVMCAVIGKLIESRNPRFLYVWQKMFILAGILGLVVGTVMSIINGVLMGIYVGAERGLSMGFSTFFTELFSFVVPLTIAFFIWNTYFTKSVRVCVYMGTDEYLRRSIFNKATPAPFAVQIIPQAAYQAPVAQPQAPIESAKRFEPIEEGVPVVYCCKCANPMLLDSDYCPACGNKKLTIN